MGFACLLAGVERRSPWWDSQPVDLGRYGVFRRVDLYPLVESPALAEAVRLWRDWHRFGLAHGAGYAAESEEYVALLNAFEDEYENAQSDAMHEAGRQNKGRQAARSAVLFENKIAARGSR